MGDCTTGTGTEAGSPQAGLHPAGVEVVVKRRKFNRFQDKGGPALTAQGVAQNGFDILFIPVITDFLLLYFK